MADNTRLDPGADGELVVTREVTHAGDTSKLPGSFLVGISGTEGSYTIEAIDGTAANGIDVDVTRVSGTVTVDGSGVTQPVSHSSLAVVGGGTEAAAMRVTLANDSTGTLTVDGTVTANAGTGTFTVDGSGVTQPISAASLPLPTGAATESSLSSVKSNTSTATTHLSNISSYTFTIRGATFVDDTTTHTPASTGGICIGAVAAPTDTTVDANDIGVVGMTTGRAMYVSDAGGSLTVDNAGTFAVQSTLQAGTAEIGKLAAGVAEIGNVKNSGTFAVQSTLQTGSAAIGKLAANSGVDIGDVDVLSIAAGSNLIGDVSVAPRTTGGLTMHKTISAATTNATSVKASAGQIYSIQCSNVNAAVRYLKLYNKASAPTVGTDTPVKTMAIPGNTAGAGFVISWPQGLAFGTGIAFALTTEATDAGTTGVAVNEITVNMDYK